MISQLNKRVLYLNNKNELIAIENIYGLEAIDIPVEQRKLVEMLVDKINELVVKVDELEEKAK